MPCCWDDEYVQPREKVWRQDPLCASLYLRQEMGCHVKNIVASDTWIYGQQLTEVLASSSSYAYFHHVLAHNFFQEEDKEEDEDDGG